MSVSLPVRPIAALQGLARTRPRLVFASMLLPAMLFGMAPKAHAVDGCKLLLCLAGNWKNIGECVPTVRQALRDLARGHAFPSCAMSSAGNNSAFQWANEATCPPWYSNYNWRTGAWQSCSYPGVITVSMNGVWWADVFVDPSGGNTSTSYSQAARDQLANTAGVDPTFDMDRARYVPPPVQGPQY